MKQLPYILTLLIFCTACASNPETKEQPVAEVLPDIHEESMRVNDMLKKYQTAAQIFQIGSDKITKIKGVKGSVWQINPANLETISGTPVSSEITVELKELTTTQEFLSNNIQTVSDGRLLTSGGSYHIKMTSAGEELKLKSGKTLTAQLPKITGEDMSLFYGSRDSLEMMNWKETGTKFQAVPMAVKPKTKDTAWFTIDRPQRRNRPASGGASVDERITDSIISNADGKPKADKNSDEYDKVNTMFANVYRAIQIEELGWINVDRFVQSSLTPLYVSANEMDANSYIQLYVIMKQYNSLTQGGVRGNAYTFKQLPIGADARVIAFTYRKNKLLFSAKDIKIEENAIIDLAFAEAKDNDINAFFK